MIETQNLYDTIDLLFKPHYRCRVGREYLSMLREIPENATLVTNPFVASGFHQEGQVVRTESIPNMQGIMEMLNNAPILTDDMVAHPELNLVGPIAATLSIADIADLIGKEGQVELLNPEDSVFIHEKISLYLRLVSEMHKYDPHYSPPPAEDIAAFQKLVNILDNFARRYLKRGMGEGALAELRRAMRGNSTGKRSYAIQTVAPSEPMGMFLNGLNNTADVGLHFKGRDPYQFK